MDRSFRAEFRRLRAILRDQGCDPYRPAKPFVSVGAKYRASKVPRLTTAQIQAEVEKGLARWKDGVANTSWTESAFLRELSRC